METIMKISKISPEVIYVVVLAMGFGFVGPLYKGIVAGIRYATLSEKNSTKEVVVQSQQMFDKIDISEYKNIKNTITKTLIPTYNKISICIDNLHKKQKNKVQYFREMNSTLKTIISLHSDNTTAYNNSTGVLHDILIWIDSYYGIVENNIRATLTISPNEELSIANINTALGEIKNFANIYGKVILILINRIKQTDNMVDIYEKLRESVSSLKNNPLFDPDTPYFSLPVEYAENKEKEIFEYLNQERDNQQGLMALVLLYLRMKNTNDAETIFLSKVYQPQFLSNEEKVIREYLGGLIKEIKDNNPIVVLENSHITVDNSFGVSVSEKYRITNPENKKKIIVFLPYKKNNIFLKNIENQVGEKISINPLKETWKNSSYFEFDCTDKMYEFSIEYAVLDFFSYSKDYGKYYYRYGGISASQNYYCELTIPNDIKPTAFRTPPDDTTNNSNSITLKWNNPFLSFKISAINLETQKNGISGDIIIKRLLYERWMYSVTMFFLFTVVVFFIKILIKSETIYQIFFIFVAIIIIYLINRELDYIYIIRLLTTFIPVKIIPFVIMVLCVFSYIIQSNIIYGSSSFQKISSIMLISIEAYVIISFIENSDLTSIISVISVSIFSAIMIFDSIKLLSEKLGMTKKKIVFIMVSIAIISILTYNSIKQIEITKQQNSIIGVILGIIITILISFDFIINHKVVRNANNQSRMELLIDSATIKFKGKNNYIAQFGLITMILLTVISPASFIVIAMQLIGTIIGPIFVQKINSKKNSGKV
jgi:hypothetical protein